MKIMKKIISVFAALTLAVTVPAQVFAVSGTSAQSGKDQLTISDTEGFLKFAEDCRLDSYSSNLYVTLTADIELSGEYTPVPVFGGVFDGAGHTVSGVTMTADGSNVGLFRYVQRGALVKDLTVEGNISPSAAARTSAGSPAATPATSPGAPSLAPSREPPTSAVSSAPTRRADLSPTAAHPAPSPAPTAQAESPAPTPAQYSTAPAGRASIPPPVTPSCRFRISTGTA